MFRLESKILKREFKVVDGNLYSSQIINTASKMQFIPDGNGSEFFIKFSDGDELSSKGLAVTESAEKDGELVLQISGNIRYNRCNDLPCCKGRLHN